MVFGASHSCLCCSGNTCPISVFHQDCFHTEGGARKDPSVLTHPCAHTKMSQICSTQSGPLHTEQTFM